MFDEKVRPKAETYAIDKVWNDEWNASEDEVETALQVQIQ
jgi:hypothetical protein